MKDVFPEILESVVETLAKTNNPREIDISSSKYPAYNSSEYDFSVLLYSSNSKIKGYEEFGFKIDKLINFLNSRYNYIDDLVNQLNIRCDEFIHSLATTVIDRDCDIIKDLQNLEMEVVKRRAGDHYKWYICVLKRFFSTVITNNLNVEIVSNYLNALRKEIEVIALRLQNMDFENCNSDNIFRPKYPRQLQYDFEKVYKELNHPDYSGMYDYHLGKIQKYLEIYIIIDNQMIMIKYTY